MLNKKGFTLVEVLATIAIVGILSGLVVMAVTKYQIKTRNKVYENYLKQLREASVNYYTVNTGSIPSNSTNLSFDTLLSENLIETLTDPADNSKTCTATITVTNVNGIVPGGQSSDMGQGLDENGNIIESNTKNISLKYNICLTCSDYSKCKEF